MQGKLILVIGPTGSGKSALLEYLRAQRPDIVFPLSCTTRAPRPGEKDGEKYHFITKSDFEQRVENKELLEWALYGGNYYGVLKAPVEAAMAEGKLIVREVEVQGARQIQKLIPPGRLGIIFIDAGSWDHLERRVRARAPIPEPELLERRKRFEDEVSFMPHADIVVKNPDGGLEQAKKDFVDAVDKLGLA